MFHLFNHKHVSLLKSVIRILASVLAILSACLQAPNHALIIFVSMYLIAEILGIVEEVVDKRKEDK